jgi:hypothetical protein
MSHGHYEISFEFIGVRNAGSVNELRRRMEEASRIKHTGWGPFVLLTREPLNPKPVEGNVEAWIVNPGEAARDSSHCDFWRVHPSGLLFQLRGYDEDSSNRVQPGTIVDVTLPIWRVGEAMLYASRLARQYDDARDPDPDILVCCRYLGLHGRRLDSLRPERRFHFQRVVANDTAEIQIQATARQMDENIVEVLHSLLAPLYECCDFYELALDLVRRETAFRQVRNTQVTTSQKQI